MANDYRDGRQLRKVDARCFMPSRLKDFDRFVMVMGWLLSAVVLLEGSIAMGDGNCDRCMKWVGSRTFSSCHPA